METTSEEIKADKDDAAATNLDERSTETRFVWYCQSEHDDPNEENMFLGEKVTEPPAEMWKLEEEYSTITAVRIGRA
jgi:hypothetical protein